MKNPELGAIIKSERKRRNYTQEHLAQLAEVDVRTLQRAERDGSCSAESLAAIAEAMDCDSKDLIAQAEELRAKRPQPEKPTKDVVVWLKEITNGHELFAILKSSDAFLHDFDMSLEPQYTEEIGRILDDLHDFGDIQSDMMPSDAIRFAEGVGERIQSLRSEGVACFAGHYSERLVFKHNPNDPMKLNVAVVVFRLVSDHRILVGKDEKRYFVATIPGKNRVPGF